MAVQAAVDQSTGPGWVATGERSVDPESGRLVTIVYKPATGERHYAVRRSSSRHR